MAAALPFVAMAFQVVGALSGASAEKRAAEYNAAAAERNAQVARTNAAADAQMQSKEARRRIGAARAAYGAAGVAIEGSPLDVLSESAAASEMDKLNILYKGELQALGYQDTAALSRQRASDATTAGVFKAGSAILTGAQKGAFGQSLKIG